MRLETVRDLHFSTIIERHFWTIIDTLERGILRTLPLLAQGDDASPEDPVARSVAATSELADLAFFFVIFGQAGGD